MAIQDDAKKIVVALDQVRLQPGRSIIVHEAGPRRKQNETRTLETHPETGQRYLCITKWEPVGKASMFGRGSQQWREILHVLKIEDEDLLIDAEVLTRPGFLPIEGEGSVFAFMRLNWWSHGPQQIAVVLVTLLAVTGMIWFHPFSTWIMASIVALLLMVGAFVYFMVWMPWAYHYIVVTNQRLLNVYDPPFIFPGFNMGVPLSRLLGLTYDESVVGKALGFARVFSETAATKIDLWLQEGIRFMKNYREFTALMSRFLTQSEHKA